MKTRADPRISKYRRYEYEPLSGISQRHCRTGRKRLQKALKRHYRFPNNEDYAAEVKSLERFFRSGWYGMLTDLDGEYLMTGVRRMVCKEAAA